MNTPPLIPIVAFVLAWALLPSLAQEVQTSDAAEVSHQVERGYDFAVYRTIITRVDAEGRQMSRTNQFTHLGNSLHYLEDGDWRESEDLIEPMPGGAVARRGPNRAIFSDDLNSEVVFDIESVGGQRIRGGVRGILLTHMNTGESVPIGVVKPLVKGVLLPPNAILYQNAFEGVRADALIIWKHNGFASDVILRESPQLPAGWETATTRLEVVTEFFTDAPPVLRESVVRIGDQPAVVDHAVIGFGFMSIVVGKAFLLQDDAMSLTGFSPEDSGTPVTKRWHQSPKDGSTFLVESVGLSEVLPELAELPAQQAGLMKPPGKAEEVIQSWAVRASQQSRGQEPMLLAESGLQAGGLVIDFIIVPDSGTPTTLLTGETYYIRSSYYTGSSVTFQPGCVLKFKQNAYMLLYGPVSFPSTQQSPVFTSKDDDGFGEVIDFTPDDPNDPDSDGNPADQRASKALWIYYVNFNTEIKNARIRWAQRGIQYDQNAGVSATHLVQDCLFEQITGSGTAAVYVNVPTGSGVTLSGVQKYNVTTPVQIGAGSVSDTMTDPMFATEKTFLAARKDLNSDLGSPPDTMGAAGPSHYVMLVNHKVAVFNKASGAKLETAGAASFFGGSLDRDLVDPRILYDPFCDRWVACMLDKSTKAVRIAIRESSDPSGLTSNWNRFSKSVTESDYSPDFPTMGLDVNGVYIAVRLTKGLPFNPTNWMHKVIAIKKPSGCGAITSAHIKDPIKLNDNTGYKVLWVQPALNFDTGTSHAWFIGKGDPASGSAIVYNRLQWGANDIPSFVGSGTLSQSVTFPQAYPYYDLDNNLSFAVPQKPASGGTLTPNVLAGSRLQMAVVRNGFLWTCQHVGLDGGGNATYDGGTVDRTACGWYKMKIKADYSLSLDKTSDQADYGRIYDTAASQPYHYYYPSLAVNAVGDMVMGFSGSKVTEFIGAFYTGRRASGGTFPTKPVLLQAGRDYFQGQRWGDYSQTCIDPSDGKFWTIQQASENRGAGFSEPNPWYSLWVAKVMPVP